MCRAYRRLLAEAYKQPVDLAGRIGVAAHLRGATAEMEGQRLAELSPTPLPVLVRFYAHETPSARAAVAERARALAARGHALTLALVQDRAAVRDPARWMEFASDVLSRLHDVAEAVEVAHAVNRVKWGFWTLAEYRRLMDATARLRAQYPRPAWLGPAGIDFEYPRMAGFLRALPAGMRFDALSHHLYVDRRGAPENRQAGFATLGKLALARALAEAHPAQCGARLIVSEFNWPLDDTGVYSPVGSPYLYPGQTLGAPQVGAEQAAAYLLRYLLIALCSGLAERVFWWRLAAHGYGLCDDRTPELPPRPGYRALQFFLRETRGAHFTRRCPMPPGAAGFLFEQPDGTRKIWAYAHPAPARWTPDFPFTAVSGLGAPLASKNPTITLNEMPALVSGREGSLSESLSVSGSE